ncbi:MAG: tetratricopeptide repeat protein [Alphaproteobacteria bacterium]
MRRPRRIAGLAALAGLLMAAAALPAGAASYDMAQTASVAAQQEMAEGRWPEASRRLLAALDECPEGGEGRGCRLLIDFNLGYLYERWSRVAPEQQDALLKRSVMMYGRVLEEAPTHAETITNLSLVLKELGDTRGLEALGQRLRSADPTQAAVVAMAAGDGHAARRSWQAAFDAYLEAASLNPADETPRRKAIDVYRQAGGAIDAGTLMKRLSDWETPYPDAAAAGYGAVVVQEGAAAGRGVEHALLRWVSIVSSQRIVSSALVAQQFAGVRHEGIEQLQRFLAALEVLSPGRGPKPIDGLTSYSGDECLGRPAWWLQSPQRRDALARAALAVGQAAVVAREPARAEAILTVASLCAPPSEEYVFGAMHDAAFTPLDIVTELAWLEFRFPDLDPGGRKLAAVIEQLFVGKAMAYQANDLEAIQRHHVVLGQIYAAKGEWAGSGYRNATFQLSNAVRVAERRQQESGYYEPMPGIRALLGETYEKTDRKAEAQAAYVDAAQAYLDSDDLERTNALLTRARTVAPVSEASPVAVKLQATEQVLETRRAVEQRGQGADRGASWLQQEAVPGLSADFLSRQKFKVNADLAGQARQAGDAERYAEQALVSASAANTLVGTSDLLRLEQVGSLVKETPAKAAPKLDIIYGEPAATSDEPAWRVMLPSAKQPAQVRLKE